MGMLGGNPSIKMAGLGSSFQYEENNSMLGKSLEEYELGWRKWLMKTQENKRKWYSWPQENNFMMEMILSGRIRNSLNLLA